MKRFITSFFILLPGMFVQSQVQLNKELTNHTSPVTPVKVSLAGIITDAATHLPLPGATIYLPDLKKGAISDDKGYFKIESLPSGKHTIEITYQGYATYIETIEINGDITLNVSLKTSVVEKEGVTVTGISAAARIRQSPQPVTVIKRNDFINATATNTIDALTKLVPGFNAVSTGPAVSKPFIRGLGYNRVLTVNDGIKQEGQQWGDEHGIEIDDYSIQRVEVLKGPASLMYGSDAIAGVINIQSQLPAPEGSLKLTLLSEYQTSSALRGFYGNIAGTKKGFNWNAYASYKGAEDYRNKYDGRVFNSKFYNKNFGGMLGYNGSWGYSHLLVSNFNMRLGIIEGSRDSATGQFTKVLPGGEDAIASINDFKKITPEIPFQHIRHFKITADNNFKIGGNSIDVVIAWQHNQRQEFGNADDPFKANAWFNLQTTDYALRWHFAYRKNWRTTAGITGMYQTNKNETSEVIIPDYNLFEAGVFVFTRYSKDKITFSGGIRFDNRHVNGKPMQVDGEPKFSAFEKNFSNISGSAGLSYELTKTFALKANIARGFRAPNFAELASNGAHEGTNRYEIGNNNLKSELSLQGDIGMDISTEHVSLEASVFYNHISDFIFYARMQNRAGQDSVIVNNETGGLLEVFQFAQHTANLYGVELSLDVHPHPLDWLHFKNAFSYTRGKFSAAIDGSDNIPFIPAARVVTTLGADLVSKGKVLHKLYAGIESDYTFKQTKAFTGYNTETAAEDYWLIGANISADFTSKGKPLFTLNFAAENLGDIAYQNHLSRLKYLDVNNVTGRRGVFNMGRNFSIKINVPLGFKI